jgi:acetyl-CoA carboxylase carboxyl transferase subunit beta
MPTEDRGLSERENESRPTDGVPAGLWAKCQKCGEMLYQRELEEDLYVCRHCGYHRRLSARERIAITADSGSFHERDRNLRSSDPLHFPGYPEKLADYAGRTGLSDPLVWGECTIEGMPAVLVVVDFNFQGGSMGAALGEKFVRAAEHAAEQRCPLVAFLCSGGARMQEGIVSLLQMAKTAAAVARLRQAHIPYLTVGTDPLTAGVFASFASLGDVAIAEQGAIMGFAGPRVIEAAFKIKLPPGSHTAEFQHQHGMVDQVVTRRELRPLLVRLLRLLSPRPSGDRTEVPLGEATDE